MLEVAAHSTKKHTFSTANLILVGFKKADGRNTISVGGK
jgi:hypothetical protein